jgi:cytochrome b561
MESDMKVLNSRSGYGLVSLVLHWIIVFGIIAQWALAESDELMLHQSIGITILALAVLRLVWRLFNPKPAWPTDMKTYEIKLARVVHFAFYALLFAIPLSGWALASAEGEPLNFFRWFDLPRLGMGSEDTLEEVHEVLFNVLVALAAIHVIGAIKHWIAGRARPVAHG